jgi:hypothetical protein
VSTNRRAPRVNTAGSGIRGYFSRPWLLSPCLRSPQFVVFTVFTAAVIAVISEIVVVIAVGYFDSSYLLDVDRCEWKNRVSMFRKMIGIYIQSDIDAPFSLVEFLSIQSTM